MTKKPPAHDPDAHQELAMKIFREAEDNLPEEYGLTISVFHIPSGSSCILSGIQNRVHLAEYLFAEAAQIIADDAKWLVEDTSVPASTAPKGEVEIKADPRLSTRFSVGGRRPPTKALN